jgi:hypothetical protein
LPEGGTKAGHGIIWRKAPPGLPDCVIHHSSFVIRHSSFVIRHSSFVIPLPFSPNPVYAGNDAAGRAVRMPMAKLKAWMQMVGSSIAWDWFFC